MISKDNLDILVVHSLPSKNIRRTVIEELELMFPTNAPNHNYIVHDSECPLPDYIRKYKFHAIILGATFLCRRAHPNIFPETLNEYDFIRNSDAFKIAMPQDEYYCNTILDEWMCGWLDGSVDGWIEGWLDGLIDGWVDGWIDG